ncbi:MAG: cyclic beta,2-glucan synthetase [Acidobacteriota bacterium]
MVTQTVQAGTGLLDRPAAAPTDIFSHDQLQAHAAAIAAAHTLAANPRRGRPLLPRLDDSAAVLDDAYRYLSSAARRDPQPVAAEDWLCDNYHVVQHQVREIQQHLPRRYYLELPKLADGAFQGYPRVYLLARELIAHTAGRIDVETLVDFCTAYQRTAVLSIGEVWAVPIMLRLALVEEVRRLADGVVSARRSREKARAWQDELVRGADWTERNVRHLLDAGAQADRRLSPAFVVELLAWLRDQSASAATAWSALQAALRDQGDSAEEMLRIEHQRQAGDQLAIGNAITSMRLLSSIDWTLFFERVSLVDRVLRGDPAGAYAEMDFPTRDRYRHSVEAVAKRTARQESDVAALAVGLARTAMRNDPGHDRSHHVGYYLISRGRFRLEREVGYRPSIRERLARFAFRHQALGYLGTLATFTAAGVLSMVIHAARLGTTGTQLWIVAAVVLLPVSELVISLVNLIVTAQVRPRELPKLAMRDGIPAANRTLVVVPVIVDSEASLGGFLHDLEVRSLGNRDQHLHFALLSDFPDADQASLDGEHEILEDARRRIDELNARYGAGRFHFLHRERRWNAAEHRWMGWERKRGKLTELNHLLRGATDTSFRVCHGDQHLLTSVRFVITLDSDTQLPMEAARRLVGTLAHPLNCPRFDPVLRRVTEGYGVLQPRVGVSVVSANSTAFARVFSGHVGVDPYTTAVSDVYQDLFHEGSYVGKGIYDVDAFEGSLANRVPENTLLSHDLFEGFYARAGLCTDIQLVDDYPTQYLAYAARQHRWARGDWQIARWLWRTVPDAAQRPVANTLPAIARWKILDNLRRSTLAPALTLLLAAGWTILPGSPLLWTLLAVLVLAFPAYIQVGRALSSRVRGVPLREHILAERDSVRTSARQSLLSTTFLAHQTYLMIDAVMRTVWRLLVSRRHLLEWVSAEQFARHDPTPLQVAQRMWAGPAGAVAMTVLVGAVAPTRLVLALPVIALWLASPAVAYLMGRPVAHARQVPTPAERSMLRATARKTWRFFEDLLGPEDHWLIPDNFQEDRKELVAHRTSPTNIGLQLMSTLSAFDFGYLGFPGVIERLERTFATLLGLGRYRGHFYNWYDTRTLAPLLPSYVSTVDSGNLAGYLLTLKNGIVALIEEAPIVDGRALHGIEDTIVLLEQALAGIVSSRKTPPARALARELTALRAALAEGPATLPEWRTLFGAVDARIAALEPLLRQIAVTTAEASFADDARHWLERARAAVEERTADLDALVPFAASAGESPATPGPLEVPTLGALLRWYAAATAEIAGSDDARRLHAIMAPAHAYAQELIDRATRLSDLADDFVEETEFGFLFHPARQLFSIGYSVTDGRLDTSYYDTLASEARLASFVAIATGQITHEHWFKLGRALTPTGSARALLSWSASMFEYFMPLLVMRSYPATLLSETYLAVIERQEQYGTQRGVPWGISESAYNAQDLQGNYQYRAFGVPGLGLKRGLADDLVIAPYACLLAAPVMPLDVIRNLERLTAAGLSGRYGFYESIDYTPERMLPDGRGAVLPTYMAHHQGMSLVALDNALHDRPMQQRFHADPRVQAAELLLQERIPHLVPLVKPPMEIITPSQPHGVAEAPSVRRYLTPHTVSPRTQLLSNGSYGVMVTNAGGGYSRRQQLALTRWREDVTGDGWGSFCYVRDIDSGDVWSTTYQPTQREPEKYEVSFAPDRAEWRRLDSGIELATELVVSPEDDAELRRITVTNHSGRTRQIELTSYAEVVLAPGDADLAHPAFSNLFVETRSVPDRDALICVRRPREGTGRTFLVHVLSGRAPSGVPVQCETDRARFIGRGGTLARPAAMTAGTNLSQTTGAVLDPIVSLRHTVRIAPRTTVRLTFTTAYADNEETAQHLIDKYHDRRAVARALALASTHSQIEMRHLGLTIEDTLLFQRLGGRLLYADAGLRDADAIAQNRRSQRDLWKYSISGDLAMLVVTITQADEAPLIVELLKAHEYLRLKGLSFDLVVLNRHPASYLQELQQDLQRLIEGSPEQAWIDRPGGVFLRRADMMPAEDLLLMRASARVVMDAGDGGLRNQLTVPLVPFTPPARRPERPVADAPETAAGAPVEALSSSEYSNGTGGFVEQGREYAICTGGGAALPPAPWANVIAHEGFGFACTETGPGYTWAGNSHDNRLTPWRNDPVGDPPGEAVFIHDMDTGLSWSATPLPAGGGHPYVTRHGQGYSIYEHERSGLVSSLTLFVPDKAPLKVFRLTLRNRSGRPRRCSVTLYVEWVLGENRSRTGIHVVTGIEPVTGALIARNAFRQEFSERVAFLDLSPVAGRSVTADRTEFIRRNGALEDPAALDRESFSNRTGAALDPCGAIQVHVDLPASGEQTILGLLGDAADETEARLLVERYRDPARVNQALEDVLQFWNGLLGTIEVRTPDRAMDLVLNRWLLYQTLACRIWGRSAFYQSSGAFGFRDQLQDTLALLMSAPHLVRAHLLHAASRQFVEGDAQHWWHEPGGQGVRTRFSDDRLWLVYAALQYIAATGDDGVLDEKVPFLAQRPLNPDEHEVYEHPTVSSDVASLYEHCVRAVSVSLSTGAHDLPLMGTGDWNDGMNLVGSNGRGESVWLGWFLVSVLGPFADVAAARGDAARAADYLRRAAALTTALEAAWDGDWYRRAYFDDGTPLGSKENVECQIDAIAQSWAVISGAGEPTRAARAMDAVDERLIRRADGISLLLTPPFDRMVPSPGYIQGYLPGVRENGGQYTHAALWNVLAFARMGDGDRAASLFGLLNPVNHTRNAADTDRYRAEPYVVAADVYSVPPHTGRGGWTWYTGSAGWMYRVGIEAILGVSLRRGALHVDPCIPREWPRYEAIFTRGRSSYRILVENPSRVCRGVERVELDGGDMAGADIPIADDGREHTVRVLLGSRRATAAIGQE